MASALRSVRVATTQFYSHTDVSANLELCIAYMQRAKKAGAELIVFPENANRCRDFKTRESAWELCEDLSGPFVQGLQEAAREVKIIVVAGVDIKGKTKPECNIAQIIISENGQLLYTHLKTVLWDYEYTLFVPGSKELEVTQTSVGKLGLLMCADGICPEVPRVSSLKGAEILCNSLNSRGPDEMRSHEPLRAIENHVWMIASNTVGGPEDAYPWTGGSQIISPRGETIACAGETDAGMVWADITPFTSFPKYLGGGIGSLDDFRRPDLYHELLKPMNTHVAATMYGPIANDTPKKPLQVATLQLSWYHSTQWTVSRTLGQITYAASRGTQLAVFPELWCFKRDEVAADPLAAAKFSASILEMITTAASESSIYVVANLVEHEKGRFYSTAYLVNSEGKISAAYRKTHLGESERAWATPGDDLVVADTPIGRIGLMIGNEVWLPEVSRILTLRGAEIIAHPADWDRVEAATMAAVERTEENRTHLVSCARTDNPAKFGSQIVIADRFRFGQCIALMRYPTAIWSRTGFEENIFMELDLMDSHSKMMGFNLDPVATMQPSLYEVFVQAHP
ncbi:putative CN hydrolase domain-containing protein [Seiridium unicorne]|uniref:CN hydrolase domain-containing protein n=1 Tax=Seiridium unicorne TaxID=138068 RepID=A0ABR2VFA6_9PEZI